MITDKEIHSSLTIPPGEYLEEVIGELGMTKDELARQEHIQAEDNLEKET